MGIEPTSTAWKAEVLPLNYTRTLTPQKRELTGRSRCRSAGCSSGGGGRIRTYEGMSQQIYSLPPLAAWVPLRQMSRIFSFASACVSMSHCADVALRREGHQNGGGAVPGVGFGHPAAPLAGPGRARPDLS